MALASQKLKYRRNNTNYSIDLYTSTSDLNNSSSYLAVRAGGQTLYANLNGQGPNSHLRARVGGSTKIVNTNSTFTATWDSNGGTPTFSNTAVVYENAPTPPGTPTRTYFTFNGWNDLSAMTSNRTITAQWTELSVGSTGPAGGILFYDKGFVSNGWRFLEAWTADEGENYLWKTSNTTTGGTSTAIGTGFENTYNHLNNAAHPAGQRAATRTHGGFSDWFLPSKDELDQLYLQRNTIGNFASDFYWSSSVDAATFVWWQYFLSGLQFSSNVGNSFRVRAVRRF